MQDEAFNDALHHADLIIEKGYHVSIQAMDEYDTPFIDFIPPSTRHGQRWLQKRLHTITQRSNARDNVDVRQPCFVSIVCMDGFWEHSSLDDIQTVGILSGTCRALATTIHNRRVWDTVIENMSRQWQEYIDIESKFSVYSLLIQEAKISAQGRIHAIICSRIKGQLSTQEENTLRKTVRQKLVIEMRRIESVHRPPDHKAKVAIKWLNRYQAMSIPHCHIPSKMRRKTDPVQLYRTILSLHNDSISVILWKAFRNTLRTMAYEQVNFHRSGTGLGRNASWEQHAGAQCTNATDMMMIA